MPKMKIDPNESKHCPKLPQNVAVAHQLEQPQNIPQCDVEILLFGWMLKMSWIRLFARCSIIYLSIPSQLTSYTATGPTMYPYVVIG